MQHYFNMQKEDILFSRNNDFSIKNGDLEDSLGIPGLGFLEEVELRIKSSYGDWYFDEQKGANLYLFEGQMITVSLLENLRESIQTALTYDDFLITNDFKVSVAQIDMDEVAVKIEFSDNIQKYIDYTIHDVKIIFNFKNGTPKIVRM